MLLADRLAAAPAGTIDVHTHAIDPDLPSLAGYEGSFPGVERRGSDRALITMDGRAYREVDERSWSAAARLRDMDAEGVAVQVLSPVPVTLSHDQPVEGAALLARSQNDFLSRLCAEAPHRFLALGAVPLQDPALAVAELGRCLDDLDLVGVEIGTRVGDRELGDPAFLPFFEAAAARSALVLIHPVDRTLDPRLQAMGVTFGLGMPVETATAAAGLLVAGLLDAVPGLRLCLAHGGGALPQVLPRLDLGQQILGQLETGTSPALRAARGLWCDSLTYDVDSLLLAARRFGEDHVLLGTDYPFAAREVPAGRVLAPEQGLDRDLAERIGRTNALTLLTSPSIERTPA